MAQIDLIANRSHPFTDSSAVESVILQARKYAKSPGNLILLPLLPNKPPAKTLPTEIWIKILGYVFAAYTTQRADTSQDVTALRQSLLVISKTFKDVALPLYYRHVQFTSLASLQRFVDLVHAADKRWDSIRRIPYSTPGRWVQVLDIADLQCPKWTELVRVDAVLTRLFPLLPFLRNVLLNNAFTLSHRASNSLILRDGNEWLTSITGIKLVSASVDYDDPFLRFLRCCPNLERLEFSGSGIEPLLADSTTSIPILRDVSPEALYLPKLRKLSMLTTHCSPVMFALLHSDLPSLTHLTVTPYDDTTIPASLVPRFIETHGSKLSSLHLFAPKSWPTMLFTSPTTLLHSCPKLYHLSLENPLPVLTVDSTSQNHPLHILSIPKPTTSFLSTLESLLPKLPELRMIRARDVRWLRAGMSSHAMEAGVQGELRQWRLRLGRRGINVVDTTWSPPTV